MQFWFFSIALAAGVAVLILRAATRKNGSAGQNSDLMVYRDQLAEVDRDEARGIIDAEDPAELPQ